MADLLELRFFIRYTTHFGQGLWVMGDINELGNEDPLKAIPLSYLNKEFWYGSIQIKSSEIPFSFRYCYLLIDEDGEMIREWGNDRVINLSEKIPREIQVVDTWNHAGDFGNVFFTKPFHDILLKNGKSKNKITDDKSYTHIFKVKAPLLNKNETVCLVGDCEALGEWSTQNPILLNKIENWWTVNVNLKDNGSPFPYKYGVYDIKNKKYLHFENGNNRVLFSNAGKKKITIIHDGFVHMDHNTWKGAGVAIPVFSLRSKKSFGVGEFSDLQLLIDWAKASGFKMIQLLPVNDTTAFHNRKDSYPYAAISAFALHPIYINLFHVAGKELAGQIKLLKKNQQQLNDLPGLNYEAVLEIKLAALKELYMVLKEECFASIEYKQFFLTNKYWLEPYACYAYFRDKSGTPDFTQWGSFAVYDKTAIDIYFKNDAASFNEIEFWYFVQFHLHIQLKEAATYACKQGIVLKGDIPIGVYRNSCDVWMAPDFFNRQWQAGAPPDAFTAVGQNWGFPIYNWKKMEDDNFSWWKERLNHMSNYFDAYRIDHVLGFFRIWSIPIHATQGLMGRFIPAIPVNIFEFEKSGIWFDHNRFCKPYINDEILTSLFNDKAEPVKERFLSKNEFGGYDLLPGYKTQQEVAGYFESLEKSDEHILMQHGINELIANIILFEENPGSENFHFRILMEETLSFKYLNPFVKEKLNALYLNYYFHRQEKLWAEEAMHKLLPLKSSTDMMVCGEDLGMIPNCVKDVMQNLGILKLEVQRMPKDPQAEFFHPADADYLSVVTPSTHDMSTIRGWWMENKEITQRFYNQILGLKGEAPSLCEIEICKAIMKQHLNSPAIWCVFQLQDVLGISEKLRSANPTDERINNPADPDQYWNYRMHLNLEALVKAKSFNDEIKKIINQSGRL